jgi:RNA polymerase sigma-70 factor (ECF subfamily)
MGVVASLCSLTDAELVRRYQSGDADAFRPLYLRYRDRLHRFILRMIGDVREAEEVFQEVWLSLIRNERHYEPQARFVTYLFAIAHRRAVDRLRSRERKGEALTDSVGLELIEDSMPEPDTILQTEQNARTLLDAISRLPALQREAFLMQADGELTLEEIAHATDSNRETVKSRLRYAYKYLRRAVECGHESS